MLPWEVGTRYTRAGPLNLISSLGLVGTMFRYVTYVCLRFVKHLYLPGMLEYLMYTRNEYFEVDKPDSLTYFFPFHHQVRAWPMVVRRGHGLLGGSLRIFQYRNSPLWGFRAFRLLVGARGFRVGTNYPGYSGYWH